MVWVSSEQEGSSGFLWKTVLTCSEPGGLWGHQILKPSIEVGSLFVIMMTSMIKVRSYQRVSDLYYRTGDFQSWKGLQMSSQSVGWPTMSCLTLQCVKGIGCLWKPSNDFISFRMKPPCLTMTLYQYCLKPCPLSLLRSVMMTFVFLAKSKFVPTLHLPTAPARDTVAPCFPIPGSAQMSHAQKNFLRLSSRKCLPSHTQLHYPTLLSHTILFS